MIRATAQRLWRVAGDVILVNAGSLVGTTAVTSLLGVVYWWLAARSFTAEAVGLASAAIAAMLLIGTLSMLGFGTLLIAELPRRTSEAPTLLTTALAVATAVGTLLGAAFALIAPLLIDDFAPLGDGPAAVMLFAIGVGLTSGMLVLDQALIGLLRGGLQFARNAIFAAGKLALLAVVALVIVDGSGVAILATWVLGLGLSVVAIGLLALPHVPRPAEWRPRTTVLRGKAGDAFKHHTLNLALQVPNLALPLIVTAMLSATTNAYFYTAWMVAGFVAIGPYALTLALYAVGTREPLALAERARFTLRLAAAIAVAGNIVVFLGADLLLGIFGSEYAENAATTLRIVALGVFPLIIKDHYVTIARVQGWLGRAGGVVAGGAMLELAGAAVGAYYGGLAWLGVGWLLAVTLEALVMSPAVYRAVDWSNRVPAGV